METASRRIHELDEPAYIKDSSLRFVAANDALAAIAGTIPERMIGLRTDEVFTRFGLNDWEEKERRTFVFGEDETALFDDPFHNARYMVDLERFISEDDLIYVFARFRRHSVEEFVPRILPDEERENDPEQDDPGLEAMVAQSKIDDRFSGIARLIMEGISELDAGILVYDKHDVLRYVNEKFYLIDEIYRGRIVPGMRIEEILAVVHDLLVVPDPNLSEAERYIARHKWISGRLDQHHLPYHEIVSDMGNGRFVRIMNRCLPSGVVICLRIDITEQKVLEEKLRRQMDEVGLFKEILEDLPVAAFVRDENLKLLYGNAAYVDLLGQPLDTILGKTVEEMIGHNNRMAIDHNQLALKTGLPQASEMELVLSDDRRVSIFARSKRVTGAAGDVFLIGTATDISDLKMREQDLVDARHQALGAKSDLENIIDLLPSGVVVLDAQMNFELVNQTFCKMSSVQDKAEFIGTPFEDYVSYWLRVGSPDKTDREIRDETANWMATTRKGTQESIEITYEGGETIAFTAKPFGDGRIIVTYTDISHLRSLDREISQARQELERTGAYLREASAVTEQGLLIIEGDKVVFQNESLVRILGLDDSFNQPHLWGAGFEVMIRRGDFGDNEEAARERLHSLTHAIQSGTAISRITHLAVLDRWVKLEVHPAANARTVVTLTDVTELKKREIELEKLVARAEAADRSKSEFLAHMSHEIRTPMNGVLAMAGLLAKSDLDTRQKTFVDVVMKSGKTLLTIINDILDFSKMGGGKLELKHVVFSPAEAVEDIALLLSSRAAERNLDLVVDIDSQVPGLVRSDAGRYRQIITNLLSNAVKFTEFGHIALRLVAVPGPGKSCELVLTIEDTGVGMAEDTVESLMTAFSNAAQGKMQHPEGTGLGLPITAGLVNLFAGDFRIDSTLGKGTRITVSIPVAVESYRRMTLTTPNNVQGKRILVIDDHEMSRNLVVKHLKSWGFDVAATADGQEGLDILQTASDFGMPVDMVMIDYSISEMTGIDIASSLRNDPRFARTAMVFMTPLDEVADGAVLQNLNVQALLAKPVRTSLLHETIVGVLQSLQAETAFDDEPVIVPMIETGPDLPDLVSEPDGKSNQDDLADDDTVQILVAEDNEINKVVFTQILQTLDVSFCIVSNGEEAISAWRRLKPDLILMDVSMPVMNGLVATRRIREMEQGTDSQIPIVGVTAHAQDEDFEACLQAGMDDYIAKPLSPERLGAKILKWKITRPRRRSAAE